MSLSVIALARHKSISLADAYAKALFEDLDGERAFVYVDDFVWLILKSLLHKNSSSFPWQC